MSATIEFNGNNALITLSGAIDYSTQDEIREAHARALSAVHVNEIEIELSGVTFLDSSAIRALLVLQNSVTEGGKSLILVNCPDSVRNVFEVGGFDQLFTMR